VKNTFKALAKIDKEYEVDPIKDLLPVCPNCHLALHSSVERYNISTLKNKIQNRDYRGKQNGR